MKNDPIISVIVCTRNRAKLLEKCINSLIDQQLHSTKFEIIIVDNGSTDDTDQIINKYKRLNLLNSIYEPKLGLSVSRNSGWRIAKGKYIGFIDDDAIASRGWLESALKCFEIVTPKPAGLTGPIYLKCEIDIPSWINDELKFSLGHLYWDDKPFKVSADHNIIGANCFFTKDELIKFNGFEEYLGRKGKLLLSGEETKLKMRIESNGGFFYYHPDVFVWHNVSPERLTERWFYKRYFWGGISDWLMKKTIIQENKFNLNNKKNLKRLDQLRRAGKNILWASGISGSYENKVWGRIYLSYAIGYMIGEIKWRQSSLQDR